jgi:hypothetical protein
MALTDSQPVNAPERTSALQILSRLATVGIVLGALYVGWTFYSRKLQDDQAEHAFAAKKEAARKRQADLIFGSGEVKIVSYSVDKASIPRGESANLCYGVINATKVVLEPHVEDSKPSAYHCLTVEPVSTTTYTLTASNDQGQSKTLSVTVRVR